MPVNAALGQIRENLFRAQNRCYVKKCSLELKISKEKGVAFCARRARLNLFGINYEAIHIITADFGGSNTAGK